MLGCINQPATTAVKIFFNLNWHRRRLSRGKIVAPDISRLLEYDRVFPDRRKPNVEISEVCELLCFFACKINNEQVHPVVAIGNEVDFVVRPPHWADVLRWIICYVFSGACVEIVNPNVIGHAAAIMFPCPELPEHPVVSHLRIVRRK